MYKLGEHGVKNYVENFGRIFGLKIGLNIWWKNWAAKLSERGGWKNMDNKI